MQQLALYKALYLTDKSKVFLNSHLDIFSAVYLLELKPLGHLDSLSDNSVDQVLSSPVLIVVFNLQTIKKSVFDS